MSFKGNRAGRGEALRQLIQKASESREHGEPTTSYSDVGVQGSSGQTSKSMGRSAALVKLLESASPNRSSSTNVPFTEEKSLKRESLPPSQSKQPVPLFPEGTLPLRSSMDIRRGAIRATYREEPERENSHRSLGRTQPVPQTLEREIDAEELPPSQRKIPPLIPIQELSQLSLSGENTEKPPVIKKGSFGKEVPVATNYLRLKVEEGKGVFQYDVRFNPEVDSLNVRFQLMKEVTRIVGETKSFDGVVLYLPIKLPDKITTAHLKLPTDKSDVTMKITYVKQLRMGDKTTVHLYNVLFKKIMNVLGLVLHGRDYYDPLSAMQIPAHKMEIWPGYITVINEYEDGIMLCCESTHRVLRTQTVHELMQDLMNSHPQEWKEEFLRMIIGQVVLTRYNNKVYRVDDVAFEESPKDTFTKGNGQKVSYQDYYRSQYNIKIKDFNQPLLKSRSKAKLNGKTLFQLINLLPELCFLTGVTDNMRADMRVMKEIAQCTRINPNQRQYAFNEFINNVNSNKEVQKMLSSWGLSLATNNVKLTARIIPPESIFMGNEVVHYGNLSADWSRTATSNPLISPIELKYWAIICTNRDEKVVGSFVDMIKKCTPQLGIKFHSPQIFGMSNDSTQTYIKTLQSTKRQNLQIIIIIFPVCRMDKYSAVKKWCCVDNPIPSQVIQTRTIRKPERLRSVTQKIVLQMNCKLGGALWTVDIPLRAAMVVGLDTYHDKARREGSVGAIVASVNKPLTRWYSKIYKQSPGIELIDGLEMSILACLQKYKEVNGIYPEQILIYRDGVGDGQLNFVLQYEMPQIITACRRISLNYDPKFLFVVVQKRINTRIFAENQNQYVNPSPGTVVDHTITRREYWDFFLVSQSVNQGTVSPTHYVVLHNTTKMNPDQVQRLTYKLTHLYYNWCGTVRVPAPCQYAHKLAYLIGESVHKETSEYLADKLYFL